MKFSSLRENNNKKRKESFRSRIRKELTRRGKQKIKSFTEVAINRFPCLRSQ
jgi:hypothetical protein